MAGEKGWQALTVDWLHTILPHSSSALSLSLSCLIASAHGLPARAGLSYGPQLSLLFLSFKFCKVKGCRTHRSYYGAQRQWLCLGKENESGEVQKIEGRGKSRKDRERREER